MSHCVGPSSTQRRSRKRRTRRPTRSPTSPDVGSQGNREERISCAIGRTAPSGRLRASLWSDPGLAPGKRPPARSDSAPRRDPSMHRAQTGPSMSANGSEAVTFRERRRIVLSHRPGLDRDGPLMEAKRGGPGFARAGTTRAGVRLLDVPIGTPPGGALRRRASNQRNLTPEHESARPRYGTW